MKELNFEQMEKVQGGYHYCAMICHWWTGGSRYQGSWSDLAAAYYANCTAYC